MEMPEWQVTQVQYFKLESTFRKISLLPCSSCFVGVCMEDAFRFGVLTMLENSESYNDLKMFTRFTLMM